MWTFGQHFRAREFFWAGPYHRHPSWAVFVLCSQLVVRTHHQRFWGNVTFSFIWSGISSILGSSFSLLATNGPHCQQRRFALLCGTTLLFYLDEYHPFWVSSFSMLSLSLSPHVARIVSDVFENVTFISIRMNIIHYGSFLSIPCTSRRHASSAPFRRTSRFHSSGWISSSLGSLFPLSLYEGSSEMLLCRMSRFHSSGWISSIPGRLFLRFLSATSEQARIVSDDDVSWRAHPRFRREGIACIHAFSCEGGALWKPLDW